MKNLFYKFLIRIFSLLPLGRKKILFFSYYGAQYGCNPKYLSQYIIDNSKDFDVVWAFNHPENYSIPKIRKVTYYSVRFFYELCTAKVIITNYRFPLLFSKRKNQVYIQTWHSSLRLKTIEKDAEQNLPSGYVEMAHKDSKSIDCLISGCRFSTEIFRSAFWYDGLILESGTPRNDLFFSDCSHLKHKLSQKYGFEEGNKLLLYAPTFRQNGNYDCYDINYSELKCVLSERFGGEWTILVRLHPHLQQHSQRLLGGFDVIDVTRYDDVQELLGASDFLISDYSSLIFDFTFTGKPCFLYLPDLDDYIKKERKLYFDINKLPFVKTYSNNDLMQAIIHYNEMDYQKALAQFDKLVGSFECGKSCQKILNYINNKCKH